MEMIGCTHVAQCPKAESRKPELRDPIAPFVPPLRAQIECVHIPVALREMQGRLVYRQAHAGVVFPCSACISDN